MRRIVIQCAGTKQRGAASLHASDGRPVRFVAHPELAPADDSALLARPDDLSEDGRTWRQRLIDYNAARAEMNPLGLLPAGRLYRPEAYGALVAKFGTGPIFILSAGWGVIPADFLTPDYDITFAASANPWKRRRKNDRYDDLQLLPDTGDEIVFLGGKDYLPLFVRLTASLQGQKTVFFNSASAPELPAGFEAVRYETTTRTNWHYEAARDLISGG